MNSAASTEGQRETWVHVAGAMEEEEDCDESPCWPPCRLFTELPKPVRDDAVTGAGKLELHRVLNAFQHSPDYGVHVCESFKDPRRYVLDEYWDEVFLEAFSIDDLHHVVGGLDTPLTPEACARLHQFSRALERLSRRVDRIVLGRPSSSR